MDTFTCRIEKIEFAKGERKPYDPVAIVECLFYDPNDPQYREAGITPDLVKERAKFLIGKHVDIDHILPFQDPQSFKGYIIDVWTDEEGKAYCKFAVFDPQVAEYLKNNQVGVSAEWLKAVQDGKVVDVFPYGLAICINSTPKMEDAKILNFAPIAMANAKPPSPKPHGHKTKPSKYKDVPDELFADKANWKFPCDTPARVKAALVYISKLFNHPNYKNMYSREEWQYLWNFAVKRALELGIGHKYNPNNPLDRGLPESIKKQCDGYDSSKSN